MRKSGYTAGCVSAYIKFGSIIIKMEKEYEVKEIDIFQLLLYIGKKWWLMLVSSVVCALLAFTLSRCLITPMYTAGIKMYVNNSSITVGSQSLSISSGDISAAKNLVDTYGVILQTRLTLEDVIEESGVSYSYEQLRSMITSGSVNNTEILEVKVTSADAEEACLIANTVAKILPEKIAAVVEGSSVRVVDLAVIPAKPSSPSYVSNSLLGFLVGFVFAAAIVVVRFFINDVIDSEDWLRDVYGDKVPVLAVIPDVNVRETDRYGRYSRYGRYYAQNEERKND